MIPQFLLNALFPERCIGCRAFDTPLCAQCTLGAIEEAQSITMSNAPITHVTTLGHFTQPLLQLAIHRLKFSHASGFAKPLGSALAGILATHYPSGAVLVPIPLHQRRIRERGYNQSTRIASAIATHTHWPVADILKRTTFTTSQTTLSDSQRQRNVSNVFSVSPQYRRDLTQLPASTTLILVDDVITTGATLASAASILQQHTTAHIDATAIARGR